MPILIGNAREDFAREDMKVLRDRVEHYGREYKRKPSMYRRMWFLLFAKYDPFIHGIVTKIMSFNQPPPKAVGTMCFYVDYKECKGERLWVLPQDLPFETADGDAVDSINQYTGGMIITG